MTRSSPPLKLILMFLLVSLLAACAPGQATLSPDEVAAQVATSVAMTVEAQGQIATAVALTIAAKETEQAASQPTPTLIPLETATSALLTATPFPTATLFISGGGGGGGGGGSGAGSSEYACDPDIQKRPLDNTHFSKGETFDIKFTIKNTGTKTWPAGYDLTYFSGPNMAPAFPAVIELPEMKPGDLFTVGPYDAIAPAEKGFHVMTFKLQGGFCWPYIAINVP